MRKTAFTLAEVLITIGIIGVVAALLIPGINDKIERHRNAVVLKRAYADLQNYLKMLDYEYDCGKDFHTCFPGENELRFKLVDYLVKKQKFRSLNQNSTGYKRTNTLAAYTCSAVGYSVNNHSVHCLISPTGEYAYFIGGLVHDNFYELSYANREYYRAKIDIVTDAKKLKICKWTCRDKNDYPKAKIDAGRNMFTAFLTDKRVFPNGSNIGGDGYYWCPLTDDTCSKEKDNFSACFQKVINDGWQIKYPYSKKLPYGSFFIIQL